MNPRKLINIAMLFTSLLIPVALSGETGAVSGKTDKNGSACNNFILEGGKIYRFDSGLKEIPIDPGVLGICSGNEALYYIRSGESGWIAGIYNTSGSGKTEYSLGSGYTGLLKLLCSEKFFYFISDRITSVKEGIAGQETAKSERVLVRFDPDTGDIRTIPGAEDFILAGSIPVLLRPSGLDVNGVNIPLTVTGSRYIDHIIDGRFVFVSNGTEIEIIDILAERNIYLYREGKVFPAGTEYNIILEFSDSTELNKSPGDSDNMIYYEVILNGAESGRTETAPSIVAKTSTLKAEPGKYCLIRAERWELDKVKGRYVRANNIYQPEELKIFVPENRIIKVIFGFNGERYNINQRVYDN